MPYTTENLKDAIKQNNIRRVQEILADRDERGVPRVAINQGFGNLGTALLWTTRCETINIQIMQLLLDLRDRDGNPICNINHLGPHGQTVFSFILDKKINARVRRQLLQNILDVRGANGALIANLATDQCNITLLVQAVEINDIDCLRILLDVRAADGSMVLDVNELRHGSTLLDIVQRRDSC